MKNLYRKVETIFEKLTALITTILGSSFSFIAALCMVIYLLFNKEFYTQDLQHIFKDLIPAITFLSLFVIQKEFNRFTASIHLKINELVASNKQANNAVLNIELKTEHEIHELTKEYTELAEKAENK